jgi:hypothetical protein
MAVSSAVLDLHPSIGQQDHFQVCWCRSYNRSLRAGERRRHPRRSGHFLQAYTEPKTRAVLGTRGRRRLSLYVGLSCQASNIDNLNS